MSFANLKRSSQSSLDKLSDQVNKLNSKASYKDERYWTCATDKAKNGYAVIRFLPSPEVDGDEADPWARMFTHGFKGPTGQWYIENCLSTIKLPDPCSDYNTILWNSSENDKGPERTQARVQKRQLNYHSNIYVVSDPANPENEGKVFLFRYGSRIFDKLKNAMFPPFPDMQPFNPFDLWAGANFKLRIRQVDGNTNYDLSEFEKPAPLLEDDAALEEIYKKEYSLKDLVTPDKFKSYEQLQDRLNLVLGLNGVTPTKKASTSSDDDDDAPFESKSEPSFKSKPAPNFAAADDDDDDLAFFNSMNEDAD
jgi:hypothetical protein